MKEGHTAMSDMEHTNISDTFGWTASSIWKNFANDKNGTFCKGNLFKEQSITLPYDNYMIVFSSFRRANNERGMNTQIKVFYQSKSNFILKIRKKSSIYTPFIYLNRLQNMDMDNPVFNKWIIRTNNKTQCSQIFTDNSLTDLLGTLDLFCLETRKKIKSNKVILYLEINGIVDNRESMENCFALTTKLLNRLDHMTE